MRYVLGLRALRAVSCAEKDVQYVLCATRRWKVCVMYAEGWRLALCARDAGGYASTAALYAGGWGGWTLFAGDAGGDTLYATLYAGGCGRKALLLELWRRCAVCYSVC